MARSIAQVATGSGRNRGVLMLAALFGVLSAALMFAFLSSRGGNESVRDVLHETGEVQSVIVLARDVDFGETITADMLTEKSLPLTAILPGAMTNRSELIGQVTTAPLFAGEQVVAAKITTDDEQNTLAFKVPPGMRALSLQVPHESWINAGLPQPGDRVDVLALTTLITVDPLTGQEKPEVVAALIGQDIEVLAVAQSLVKYIPGNLAEEQGADEATAENTGEASEGAANGSADGADDRGTAYRPLDDTRTYEGAISVTLALEPADAARIAMLDAMKDEQGQYRLLTRYQADRSLVEGQTMWTLDELFAQN